MKELEQHLNQNLKVEITKKKKQEIEYIFQGTITPKKGHTLWEINEVTGLVKKAEYEKTTAAFNNFAKLPTTKLVVNPDCIYIPALNKQNAIKKYMNDSEQSSYYDKQAPSNLNDIALK